MSPFTTLRARLPCSISVRPLDPHVYPEADRAFVTLHRTDGQQEAGEEQLQVRYEEESKELLLSSVGLHSGMLVHLTAPIKTNIFITTEGTGSVQVKKMECDVCKVQTEDGDCVLQSLRAHQVEVKSRGGQISGLGTIHGNVDITAGGDSAVDVKKLQGTKMNVSTERGPLKVKAIYAESSCISSCSGKVQLGNVHGCSTVKNESGDTVIDGSNSFLKVSSLSGAIDVYVGDSADIHSQEGAVNVRVPSSLRAGVELRGASVDVSPEVVLHGVENNSSEGRATLTGFINSESPVERKIKAQADRGSVSLRIQSWFESLKLGG